MGIAEVKDIRNSIGLRYPLQIFLTMVSLSIINGYNSLQGIATFFESNKEEFIELFIPITIKNTQIPMILKDMNYDSLLEAFQSWIIERINGIVKQEFMEGNY